MSKRNRRVILHIGTAKTGSTTIQHLMAERRAELLQRGFCYPRSPGKVNHIKLALYAGGTHPAEGLVTKAGGRQSAEVVADSFPREFAREMAALPSSVHTVILSNEHCFRRLHRPKQFERLRDLLEPHFDRMTVLVYLRRQDELAVSQYSTALRNGNAGDEILPARRYDHLFDYAAIIGRWAEAFGEDAIRPRLFGRGYFAGGDLVTDWLSTCGLDDLPTQTTGTVHNPSLQPAALDLLLRFNRLVERTPGGRLPPWIPEVLNREFSGAGRMPSRAEAEAFYRRFLAGNERLRSAYFPDRETLFDEDFSRYPQAAPPPASDAEVLDVALRILAHTIRDPARESRPPAPAIPAALRGWRGGDAEDGSFARMGSPA